MIESNEGLLNALVSPKKQKSKDSQVKNIFSRILDDVVSQEEKLKNPELIRVRNNLLLILFLITAYGIFYLIGDFINILLTAFIAGIAYQQTRERFVSILMNKSSYSAHKQSLGMRLVKCFFFGTLCFILPKIRHILANPDTIWNYQRTISLQEFILSIKLNNNVVIFTCQIMLILHIIYLLLGPYLKKIGKAFTPKNRKFINFIFLILTIVITLVALIVIPSILFREVSSVGYLVQQRIQQKLGCQIISIQAHDNSTLPYCSDKITTQNEFIKQTIAEFKDQNQTIQNCIKFVKKIQMDYIGQQISTYDQIACTWFVFLEKASNYSGLTGGAISENPGQLVMTGTNIFTTFFGNLTFVLSGFSNLIFSATTFLTMFVLTTQTFRSSNMLKEVFSEQKQQLVSSITNLIQATFFIVFQHFIMSVILLEVFDFTNINLLIATMLSSMAFFPFFRPWFGTLIVALIRFLVTRNGYIQVIFVVLYYYTSEKIYSFHYRKMEIHEIVTNMSVLFGIYRFGISGIFYGPLIIILYKCVTKQLMN